MKVVLLLSGGMDSAVLLSMACRDAKRVLAVSFDYGQRHAKELQSAEQIALHCNIDHCVVSVDSLAQFIPGSSLTDHGVSVPHGHYADESMRITVVPFRNMIMLSIAASISAARGFDCVGLAAHAGDHAIYPDCRPAFFASMEATLSVAHYSALRLWAPFLSKSKADIVRIGAALGVPFHLTWSCYEGREMHCGECGTCVERKEAFAIAKVVDPTTYVRP